MISLFFVLLLYTKTAITYEDVKDYDIYQLGDLFRNLIEYKDVTNDDVNFYLYTRDISNEQIPLIGNSTIDLTKNTKMVIHGWIDNHNRSWYHLLTDKYLDKGDFNVIHVDWWRIARSFYLSSAHNTKLVGKYIASFILTHNLDLKKTHLIGHSLGAHIAGFAAKTVKNITGTRLARITGLDPAGPGFESFFVDCDNRLNSDDADVVDVFHTDGGFLGCYIALGTFDIYINGGIRIQPDCRISLGSISSAGELFEDFYCSHTRSYVRFIEIINDVKYTCQQCDSWLNYMLGLCKKNENYVFGAEDINEKMTGICFVSTEKQIE